MFSGPGFPRALRVLFACVVLAVLTASPGVVRAGKWEVGARLQSAGGWDSNPHEATAEHEGGSFFRAQGELGCARAFETPFARRAELSVRGFDERYMELPVEHRAQLELRFRMDQSIGKRGGAGRLELSTRNRAYPDTTQRNFSRDRVRWDGRFRLGPKGTLRPSVNYDQLDLEGSAEDDRKSFGVGMAYDWRLRPEWIVFGGLELGGVAYDRPSIVRVPTDGQPVEYGSDQSDAVRRVRVGARFLGKTVAQVEYGYLSQSSNSLGASFGSHQLQWIVSRSLVGQIRAQFFGSIESRQYRDDELDDIEILLPGEELEARDDNNLVAVQVARSVGDRLELHVRQTWFRNETIRIGTYYRKAVWSAGLTWQFGRLSGF
ncbi:MAG: hypothetical protein R3E97_08410 [Candidatus Eisenbacteria bacterium]